jgi:phospholipid/cholesterol/gamma-HCH transport system substrate-binding protein
MKRSTGVTWEQLRVGVVVLFAAALLVVSVYKLGEAANLFTKRYTLYVFLSNARGITRGGAVTINGVVAGTVDDISFLPVGTDTSRNLKLELSIDQRLQDQVRADSRASVKSMGVLGDKVLDISSGTPRYGVLQTRDTLRVTPTIDVDDVIGQASVVVQDAVELTRDLKIISGGIVRGDGTMGQLVTNRSLYDRLTGTLTKMDGLLDRMNNPKGTVGRLIDDPALYNNLTAAVAGLDSALAQVNNRQGTLGKLLYDDTLYSHLVGVAGNADSVMRELNDGQGTASKLLRDRQLYDQLTKAVATLNAVLADVRQNPRRYTRGLVRVF